MYVIIWASLVTSFGSWVDVGLSVKQNLATLGKEQQLHFILGFSLSRRTSLKTMQRRKSFFNGEAPMEWVRTKTLQNNLRKGSHRPLANKPSAATEKAIPRQQQALSGASPKPDQALSSASSSHNSLRTLRRVAIL